MNFDPTAEQRRWRDPARRDFAQGRIRPQPQQTSTASRGSPTT